VPGRSGAVRARWRAGGDARAPRAASTAAVGRAPVAPEGARRRYREGLGQGQRRPLSILRRTDRGCTPGGPRAQIDARAGTLQLVTATGHRHSKIQDGSFGGALFKATQAKSGITKGLTTLTLLEDAFRGAPSYSSCRFAKALAGPLAARIAASRPSILQTLHARDHHGRFRTRGRYSAGTVRGTIWDTTETCAGTLTTVKRGTVDVLDFGTRKTIRVHAGHHYLAQAKHK